jgi:hypothetical protein
MMKQNIWSLNKDQNIKALLLLLEQRVGHGRFKILDDVPHPQAIRIIPPVARPEVAVYIYCYAQSDGHYGVDLEYPIQIELAADDKTERLNELNPDRALEMIIMHLELAQNTNYGTP